MIKEDDIRYAEVLASGLDFIKNISEFYGDETATQVNDAIKNVIPEYSNDMLMKLLTQGSIKVWFSIKEPEYVDIVRFVKTLRFLNNDIGLAEAKQLYDKAKITRQFVTMGSYKESIELKKLLIKMGCIVYEDEQN